MFAEKYDNLDNMVKNKNNLSRRLMRYFLLSTLIPFFLIVMISSGVLLEYYNKDIDIISNSYIDSLARSASLYINQLKQILILPSFSSETVNKIKDISKKENVEYFDKAEFDTLMGNLISSIRYTGNDFHSAMIVTDKDTIYFSSNYVFAEPPANYDWTKESWYIDAMENNGKLIFVSPHVPSYIDSTKDERVVSIVTTIRNYITTEPYAVIKIDFLPSMMNTYLHLEEFHVPSAIYVLDDDDNMIFYEATNSKMKDLIAIENGKISEIGKSEVKRFSQEIAGTPYTLYVILDQQAIIMNSIKIYSIGLFLYLIALFSAVHLNRRFSNRITQPIASMKNVLSHVENGDFSVRYQHKEQWELEELGKSLNEMVEQLEIMIEKTYRAQIAQKEAEYQALLKQIQPHFIFNTLNTMVGLLYQERYDQLERNIMCLSDMLRNVLKSDTSWPFKEELKFIEDYLILQTTRFENRLSYSIEADENMEQMQFPRLLLQPFVENSIIHGMEPAKKKCHISIKANDSEGEVKISIIDDGVGFDKSEIDIYSSIGISNCMDRLKLFYPKSDIIIESTPGKGCTVLISFMEYEK